MKTVLVLEDEALVMKLLLHILKHYTVLKATTAAQALQFFIDRACQIDVLVADITLPTSWGYTWRRVFVKRSPINSLALRRRFLPSHHSTK
ncbi:MAG TPA: hypothetical protein VNY05_41480 [Candidatus Acidoferrales bacterium]|nr:hypothetical protein [Candidatus Acidoferrales bacterium]